VLPASAIRVKLKSAKSFNVADWRRHSDPFYLNDGSQLRIGHHATHYLSMDLCGHVCIPRTTILEEIELPDPRESRGWASVED
jgi:hypothetical protein